MSEPKTPSELRSLLAEGTGGEWRYQGEETHRLGERPRMDYRLYTVRGKFGNPATCGEEQDARSIVALHNLAPRLAALWEAAEGYKKVRDLPEDSTVVACCDRVVCDSNDGYGCEGHDRVADARNALDRALADLRGGA